MSFEPVIEAGGLGKAYPLYRRSEDRLKQLLWGRRRKFYEEFWAVRDVNLSVGRGETVGIIGRNGSGKSTLLQLICGTLKPSAGEVRVRGRVAALLELGSGFNPEFTGRENVRVGASVLGLSADEIETRFDSIAAFADIGRFMDQPLKHYSSGMHARLAFAVCANIDADVLIVDEILSVGDAAFQQKCMRFLNRFRLHGTLLFVSHDSGAIVKLCDRALWLDQGEVQGLGHAKEMCRLYLAAQAEETAEDSARFRLIRPQPRTRLVREPPVVEVEATQPDRQFSFDADDDSTGAGGALIEAAEIRLPDGAPLHVAAGGEDIELRIRGTAQRVIGRAVVAFVWRDRLGQILFSDDTSAIGNASQCIGDGKRFAASFSFRLPYLSTGPYAIEAFLFEESRLLDRKRDALIVHVQSRHIFQQGLLNVGMRAVTLRGSPDALDAYSRTPVNVDSARHSAERETATLHGMGARSAT
jgi:lipopolysaccharide transport system ATP-binding protein